MTSDVVSKPHRLKYDVFISFTGDTRHGFTEKLYKALVDENVRVFRDNEALKKGAELNPSLIEAMEDSAASVVVFSPKYPSSYWCLDELAKLFDIKKRTNHTMLPIFYKVDPLHVRKPNVHFKDDFDGHVRDGRFDEEKMERWRGAIIDFGNHNGYKIEKGKSVEGASVEGAIEEEVIIKLVVKRVLDEVNNTPEKAGEYTVGLDSRVGDLMKLVDFRSSHDGARILGLYGMGGIGKTTLAKRFYNRVLEKFDEHRVFLPNVREQSSSKKGGLVNLQGSFIAGLFRTPLPIEDVNKGQDMIRGRVREKKILAVLDDVDSVDQVNALVGERGWYGKGSLIVITTRDEEILNKLSVKLKYEVRCLTEMQALNLFSFHSRRKEKLTNILLELSKKFIEMTGRLPLAVEVLASSLYDKNDEEWRAHLAKVKDNQPTNLHDVLKMSFESLDYEQKIVFLDISCFFLKMEITKEEVIDVLNGCGINAKACLRVLREKSLLKILADKDNTLWMHDQIRDMGTQMVLNESREDPEMRSRLWDRDEIMDVLDNRKGTSSTRGIIFDFKKKFVRHLTASEIASNNLQNNPGICSAINYVKSKFVSFPEEEEKPKISEITLPVEPFAPISKLRLLQINNVELEGNLKLLPSELKWIQWKGCPLKNLPPDFLNGKLAVLDLSNSGIRRFESPKTKEKNKNLKVVNLRGCYNLHAIPDLSNHIAIEKLVLERCELLVKVPREVGNLKMLKHLDFRNCKNLSEFRVDVSGLKQLENLFLSGCSNLSVIPENIGSMTRLEKLLLDETAIKNLPGSVFRLKKLKNLSLTSCRSIQELPLSIGKLTSLEELYLDGTALRDLPDSIGRLTNLQKLHCTHCTSLSMIPDTIDKLTSLKEFFITGSKVKELPLNLGLLPNLAEFSAGQCRSLKQVPSSISRLNSLTKLDLDSTPIETLPEKIGDLRFITKLQLINCKNLKSLPESIGDMDTLWSLNLVGSNIEELPESFGKLESLEILRMNNCKELKSLPESFGNLKSLRELYMQETGLVELPESFGNLSKLKVLKMLKKPLFRSSKSGAPGTRFVIPNSFSNLSKLKELDARSWGITGKIPDVLDKLSRLEMLYLGNNYFHSLPASLKGLSNLRELLLNDCQELMSLPPLPCQLEQLNLENCFSLERISDLSELTILHELNLTNCEKVDDIPGLKKLEALRRLYMTGCNQKCSKEVKKSLSKVSLKKLRNLSLPGNIIPDWFSQGPVTYSTQPNRELIGVIIAVVVALNHKIEDEESLPCVVGIEAQIHKLDQLVFNHTLNLSGVPRTSNDQLHICRYPASYPMVSMLKDGYTVRLIKREMPQVKQKSELKMHGIHLVYEGDDDVDGEEGSSDEEGSLDETNQTVSQKLAHFFGSLEKGETSSRGDSTVT